MLSAFLRGCLWSYASISLILFVFMGYAYRVNAGRAADDPQRREYRPLAVFLFPIWPLWIGMSLSLFTLRAVTYGVFLVLFTIALIVVRKPFILIWLEKAAMYIGNKLLRMNMLVVRLFFPQPTNQPA